MSGKGKVTMGRSRVRKRPVTFGNPALGTYCGHVYTLELLNGMKYTSEHPRPLVEGAEEERRLVAMVDVPPDQVPEGVLHLARSHRPWIDHVRIVIEQSQNAVVSGGVDDLFPQQTYQTSDWVGPVDNEESKESIGKTSFVHSLSPHASAVESAASILAAEQMQTRHTDSLKRFTIEQGQSDEYMKPSRTYLVLLELSSEEAADLMVDDLHMKPYTTLDETQVCHIYHVVALRGQDGVSLMSPFFAPSTKAAEGGLEIVPTSSMESSTDGRKDDGGQRARAKPSSTNEDYNCAVCLEHMDLERPANGERTSILTTVCNHSFHLDCLLQWQDSPCPVCRYDHSGLNDTLSQCHICGTTENNYVCLICGVVSCGGNTLAQSPRNNLARGGNSQSEVNEELAECRPHESGEEAPPTQVLLSLSHARQHYDETLHAYALDIETQHVWDFAGQGFVHRLLQNKEDGKLVEVSDPQNTTSQERSQNPGLSDAQEGEVMHRKLEGFASQYYTLLKSQLEQQRIYYEGRLEEVRREYGSTKPRKRSQDLIVALRQEKQQLSQRLARLQSRSSKIKEDLAFLKSMNESLEANRGPLKKQLDQAQQERLEARKLFDECLPPLQDKVTRLMLQLEQDANSKKPAARA